MTLASAKTADARRRSAPIDDGHIILFYSFALFTTAGIHRTLQANTPDSVNALVEFNVGEMLALCALWFVVAAHRSSLALSRADLLVLCLCALLLVPPVSLHPAFLGAGFAGLWFILRHPRDAALAQVGQLWLAIGCYESFGRLLFRLLAEPLMRIELGFIATVGPLLGFAIRKDGIRLVGPDGWFITMMERCSAFHNISLALLVWLSLIKIAAAEIRRPQWMALGAAVLSVVLLNALRILLMTPSRDGYVFWHDGAGALLFSVATFFAVAAPTAASLRRR